MEPQINADERRSNELSEKIIGAAFEVSNVLGAGFLERVCDNALNIELKLRGLETLPQAPLKVHYDIHIAQCLNYLRITGLKLCLLINFNKPSVEIRRIVNGLGNK